MTPVLRRAPESRDKHLWADYFELVCLLSPDGYLARGDVEDQAEELNDVEDTDLESLTPRDPSAAELTDGRKLGVVDLFEHLRYRSVAFGEAYPFRLTPSARALQLAPADPDMRSRRSLYVLLLLASALEHFEPTERQALAAAVEGIAHDAIRAWLPGTAKVSHFGTSPGGRPAFEGTLQEKVRLLADALSEAETPGEGLYREGNRGDGGLDIVAWFPFSDRARASLAIFVQVTCQSNWADKPGELRPNKWRQRMTLLTAPPSVLVIPYCFRSPDGDWYLKGEISCVTIDRPRLISLLSGTDFELEGITRDLVEVFGGAVFADDQE